LVFSCLAARRSSAFLPRISASIAFSDPLQGLGGDRRRRRFGQVEELPAPM
jgi:hypothetical protein